MKIYYFFFCFLLSHFVVIFASDIVHVKNNDEGWMECFFKDQRTICVEKDNLILEKLIFADRGCLTGCGNFPIAATFPGWILLNKCLETDTEKLSCDQIIGAINIADGLPLTSNNKNKNSIISLLIEKAKKMLTFEDFKNIDDEEKMDQIEELKELKNYIFYPYRVMNKMSSEKTTFNLPIDYFYYGRVMRIRDLEDVVSFIPNSIICLFEYIFSPQRMYQWEDSLEIKKHLNIESVLFASLGLLTYLQPFSSFLSLAFIHAYIFKKNIQNYVEFYEYQKNIKKGVFLKFNDKKNPSYEENKQYTIQTYKDPWRIQLEKANMKVSSISRRLAISSLDGHYLNFCKNEDNCYSAYDVKNDIIVDVEKDYMIAVYLARDIHVLIKMKGSYTHFYLESIRDLSESVSWNISEIAVGKRIDNKIVLIKSIEHYNEKTSYASELNLSKDKTKLFVKLRNDIVQIFTLNDSHTLADDKILETDYQAIKFIKQVQAILQYTALFLLLYHSRYFNLRNKLVAEHNALIEREKWYEIVLSSMRLFKNKFFPPIKRFLRKEYIRVAKENRYSRAWEKIF